MSLKGKVYGVTQCFHLRGGSQQKQPPTLPFVSAILTDWSIRLYYKALNLASFLANECDSARFSKSW